MFDFLKNKESITSLLLGLNEMDDNCIASIGNSLKYLPNLQEISLAANRFTNEGIRILAQHLEGNDSIKTLNLNGNQLINEKSIESLVAIINTSCISDLRLFNTAISNDQIIHLELESNFKNSLIETISRQNK